MNTGLLPRVVARLGPLSFTDTFLVSLAVAAGLVLVFFVTMHVPRGRAWLETVYEALEKNILESVHVDARPLVPLVLTQWIFILTANLSGLAPGVGAPTRDLSITASLAVLSFLAGHVYAIRAGGLRYLRQYIEPNPILLPLNVIGELSRTLALALRLFGNMLSGHLIGAILVLLVGILLPVPMMLLGVLTAVVQAYIFGMLTLVFAASSMRVATRERPARVPSEGGEVT